MATINDLNDEERAEFDELVDDIRSGGANVRDIMDTVRDLLMLYDEFSSFCNDHDIDIDVYNGSELVDLGIGNIEEGTEDTEESINELINH